MLKRAIKQEYKAPADVNNLGDMRDFITRVGRKYGVSEQIINAFKMAIDEAGTNIIRHAYRDWEGFITIRMIIKESSVTVSLIDQGHTFDPRNVKDPDLHRYVEIGKKGGLGIFIIRRIIDEIDYRKTVEGNELRLTKYRDISNQKKKINLPEMSFSMKTRFSLIASSILTCLVLVVFIYTYARQESKILYGDLDAGRVLSRSIAHNSLDYLADGNFTELLLIAAETHRNHTPVVSEVIITDSLKVIQGIAVGTHRLFDSFAVPVSDNVKKVADNVYRHRFDGRIVYDIVTPVIFPEDTDGLYPLGTVHVLMDKDAIYTQISQARKRILFIAGLVLLIGYTGIFVLVYLIMSPFKKLSRWINALGKNEAYDEMEFDSSDEIGEIAKAFNDITEKFRHSQENLAEQERLQKEMQVAQEIQQTLLPDAFPDIEGYELASYYEAAKEVGGDYFDFVEVDKDTLGIVVADVSGKGVPGSLVMTMIRTALRTEARGNKNAADVLARVNEFVINDMKRGMFVTVFYIILDSQNRTINYASAGHNPMILYRGSTQKSYYLNPRGFPIGINLPDNSLFRKSIESDTLRLYEGDDLIIYTDGITEAMNPNRERFGEERFLSAIRKYGNLKVDPLIDKIHEEISLFTEGFAQSDDITLVAIREKRNAEDVLFDIRKRLMSLVNEEGKTVKEACQFVGVSTSTYYKYKKRYEKMGAEGLKEKVPRSEVEEKHISIEDKTKIFDIIKKHPEYGAKRICEELKSEKYGFSEFDEKRIYDELVRSRLNTKDLRLAFVERGGRGKRMKPPGTPFLTLDGQVIVEPVDRKRPVGVHPLVSEKDIKDIVEEKKSVRKRVSQKQQEKIQSGIDAVSEDEKIEEESLLDEFLGLADEKDAVKDDVEILEETIVSSSVKKEDLEDFQATDIADFDHLSELEAPLAETGKGSMSHHSRADGSSEKGEKDDLDDSLDIAELFDDLVGDVSSDDPFSVSETNRATSIEQILSLDDDILSENQESQIEDNIASSVAGDLLGDEIGEKKSPVSLTQSDTVQNDDFIKMMEGIGFDRRDVLSGRKREPNSSDEEKRSLNRKRLLEAGRWFYNQGLYEKAIDEFGKALEEDPDYLEACQCLADAYFRMGRLDKAKELYDKVRILDPTNINVLENLGVIFANKGDYKKAVWQWGEVLKNQPDRNDLIERIKKMQQVIRKQYL